MRHRCPRVPQPRLVVTNATFEFSSSCIAWSVAYVGSRLIGGMLGFSKLSMSLSTEGAAMVGVKKKSTTDNHIYKYVLQWLYSCNVSSSINVRFCAYCAYCAHFPGIDSDQRRYRLPEP